jgi:Asp-tRNA(Asn)/Glu-tRNA(Gln) amidotransferase A subunit family amidase
VSDELADVDATALAEMIRSRTVSPVEATEVTLARIERVDGEINAHTVLLADRALEQAGRAEAALARGDAVGPLCGVPYSVKDVMWVEGEFATNGCAALSDFRAPADAVLVERMRDAGAVLVGKTNNPEFCLRGVTENELYGVTRNPWNRERTPGGSSGGAGAALAARMTPLALGSDGGGSIRIPAAFCGVAGLKPTFGLLPDGPGFRGWVTMTVNGPMARSVRDLRLCTGVLAGPHPVDYLALPGRGNAEEDGGKRDLRIASSVDLGFAPVEPDVRAAFAAAVTALRDDGWAVEEAAPPTGNPNDLWTRIAVAEGYAAVRELLEHRRERVTADSIELLEAGAGHGAADYLDAMHERRAFGSAWSAFFETFDVLLTPAMQMTALPLGVKAPAEIDGRPIDPFYDDWCSFCLPANLTGQPAVSVPCGVDRHGLPIGLQVMAPRFRDDLALRVAEAWERIAPRIPTQGAPIPWR